MGDQRIGGPLLAVGWAAALIVSAIGLLFLGQRLLGLP